MEMQMAHAIATGGLHRRCAGLCSGIRANELQMRHIPCRGTSVATLDTGQRRADSRFTREELGHAAGDKSKYTDKQKRQAGTSKNPTRPVEIPQEGGGAGWATVNAHDGGGKRAAPGRKKRKKLSHSKVPIAFLHHLASALPPPRSRRSSIHH